MILATRSVILLLLGLGSVFVFLPTPLTREPFFRDAAPSSSATLVRPRPQQPWQISLGTAWRRLATGAQNSETGNDSTCPAWAKETWRKPPLPSFADLVENGEREGGLPEEAGGGISLSLLRFRAAEADFRVFLERLASRGRGVSVREACATTCGKTIEACKLPFDYVVLNTFPNSGTTWTDHMFKYGVGLSFKDEYRKWRPATKCGTLWKRKLNGTEASLVKSHAVESKYGVKGEARTPAESTAARVIHLYRSGLNNIAANFRYRHKKGMLPRATGEPDVVRVSQLPDFAYKLARFQVHWHCKTLMITPFIPTLIVNYNELLGDTEEAFRKMFNFVGNEWTEANLSAAIKLNAANKPPAPLYDESFWTEDVLAEVVRIYVEEVRKYIAQPELCLKRIYVPWNYFAVAGGRRLTRWV